MTGDLTPSGSPLSVSVVLASHNGAAFIAEQVRSIVLQSRPPLELVLSDDASSDDTVEVATRAFEDAAGQLGDDRPTLRVLANAEALGVAANFEAACAASVGELIALSDQDDVWEADRLALMVAEFEANPDLTLLHSDASLIDADGRSIGGSLLATIRVSGAERRAVRGGRAFDVLLRRNIVTGATTVFRRGLLDQARPFPAGWVHDEWLALVAAATGRVGLLDRPLTRYRQHSSNQIGATALTLGAGIGRLQTPRSERNARLLEHAGTLSQRLTALDGSVHGADLEKAAAKLRHEESRSSLPAARPRRVVPVLRVLARGGYRRYSRGATDAVRDLVQPA